MALLIHLRAICPLHFATVQNSFGPHELGVSIGINGMGNSKLLKNQLLIVKNLVATMKL